ncbi:hypothetical protein [Bacillus sp. B-jedd]|uniref:hypothetical protein n=1 Tax=Bacillus sp. B-jedd TaxID=1476857 RepID=UPI0005157170|nr:hypothetical protein [Bacillus sp. B-jedd]CEG28661.1 hypothetical protein BN1002_03584 [Bacillus sp. B-jedd]
MYELAQVEQIQDEETFKVDEITIAIDPQAVRDLDGDVILDYKNNYGFILKNSFEILTFGMKVKK